MNWFGIKNDRFEKSIINWIIFKFLIQILLFYTQLHMFYIFIRISYSYSHIKFYALTKRCFFLYTHKACSTSHLFRIFTIYSSVSFLMQLTLDFIKYSFQFSVFCLVKKINEIYFWSPSLPYTSVTSGIQFSLLPITGHNKLIQIPPQKSSASFRIS